MSAPLRIEGSVPAILTLNSDGPPQGVEIRVVPVEMKRSAGADEVVTATAFITLAANIAINVFSNWLYDHLRKNNSKRIRINRRQIEITDDRGATLRLIEESIEIEE